MNRSRVVGGRYLLLAELDRNGFGRSYQAEDRITGRQVAVLEIRLPAGASDARTRETRQRNEHRDRLLREVRAAGRIRHPGVVPVQDLVTDRLPDGSLREHLITELPDARPLSTLLADGQVPPRRVAAIGRDVLAALGAVHESGIPHGGLNPDCVLVAGSGRAVVTDIGLARAVIRADGGGADEDGADGGRADGGGFLSPERRAGGPDTPVADLWSLGAVLHHATGRRPPAHGPLAEAIAGLTAADPAERMSPAAADALLERASRPASVAGDLGRSRTLLLVVAAILLVAVVVMVVLALG
ncbi:serine/threonine-protein kinase [Pseudonocardia sp. KRD291]|uniref:serine/threonine-protein kinase n=1 Tax=Pseudonocardia sp. KRD291 TaxID=2792007 RepID=UPI001C4A62A3|nr:serine/threonine-protein kinase [Pseudonocardia sp. KRD291]MBW0103379.1 serine/threonine protein kinase [Pseudonocardia sp. KRD291]